MLGAVQSNWCLFGQVFCIILWEYVSHVRQIKSLVEHVWFAQGGRWDAYRTLASECDAKTRAPKRDVVKVGLYLQWERRCGETGRKWPTWVGLACYGFGASVWGWACGWATATLLASGGNGTRLSHLNSRVSEAENSRPVFSSTWGD